MPGNWAWLRLRSAGGVGGVDGDGGLGVGDGRVRMDG